MTKEVREEDNQKLQEELKALQEQYPSIDEQPKHPGWVSVAEVLKKTDPIFENMIFLLAYDFSSNIYVLKGDYLTIVDPGNDYTAFLALFDLEYEPGDIKKIVLTHGHRDHAMGTFELLRYPTIDANKDLEIIIHEDGPDEFKRMITEAGLPLTAVKGGETLELSGFDWEVIFTPGHTMDGISLYHGPTKTAFTGDTVLPYGMSDPDEHAGGRLDHYLLGLKLLMKKDIENILPGHGVPVVSAGRRVIEVAYESVMAKIIEVEGKIAWLDAATMLAQRELLEEAVYCSDKELARNPGNLGALQLKAFCLNDLGRCEEAVELLDRILAQQADNVHALAAKGRALLGLGKYEESLPYFDEALSVNPAFRDAQLFKGMAHYLAGRYDQAMDIEVFRTEFSSRFKDQLARAKEPTRQR